MTTVPDDRRLYHTGSLQPRKYDTDAGIDLATSETTVVPGRSFALIPTGNRIEVPPGTYLWLVARSSTAKHFGFLVLPGIIDEGFTGELYASVYNVHDSEVVVHRGDRVCQAIVMPNYTRMFVATEVDMIQGLERGESGFGSTGKGLRAV